MPSIRSGVYIQEIDLSTQVPAAPGVYENVTAPWWGTEVGEEIANEMDRDEVSTPTAIDRVNTRLVVTHLENVLSNFVFEVNDEITRSQIQTAFDQELQNLIARRAIANASTHITPEGIIEVNLRPNRTLEQIQLTFTISNPNTPSIVATTLTVEEVIVPAEEYPCERRIILRKYKQP